MAHTEQQDKNGFSTVMWGFKKDEVLEYIDRMSAENARMAQEHKENAQQLEDKIQKLSRKQRYFV